MDYSQSTADLIERQCRNVEREDFTLEKDKAEEAILKTYDLFNLSRPKKVRWCNDIFEKKFQDSFLSALSARSALSAWSARSALSARSARSALSAWSAGSAWSARSAWSAWSAESAESARSALDYDFSYYIFEAEYIQNQDGGPKPNENDYKYLYYCELLMKAKEYGVGYRLEWKDTLYLVPTPLVRINSLNQWHSDEVPAIRWKDGAEFYYLNGVHFPEELFRKVTSGKMPFEYILAIEDIDQRTQAMRFGDVEKFLKHTKAKKLDEYTKHKPDNAPVIYRLFMIPQGDVFTQDAYYMVYDDPSTGKLYMSGVEEAQTVPEAMAWKQSGGFWKCTPEQWKSMQPLVHES